ncbi:cytochrome b5 domain-containing protein [Candidatus Nomurabacteria bacterium]|nr:cytochrome b5 domain-containing protein [Candidatus Nomurabacteria bacterium]MCB9820602.1 cytochrome b5 domain-containing protein [Candidatus Nomurabacteria bacterium]
MNEEKSKIISIIVLVVALIVISIFMKINNVSDVKDVVAQTPVEEDINTTVQEETNTNTTSTSSNTSSGSTSSSNTSNTNTSTNTTTTNTGEQTFTLAQVAMHSTDGDCYTAVSGVVYDLTAWVHQHPGGDRNILLICGIDGTSAYNSVHGRDGFAQNILAGFEIGLLVN